MKNKLIKDIDKIITLGEQGSSQTYSECKKKIFEYEENGLEISFNEYDNIIKYICNKLNY